MLLSDLREQIERQLELNKRPFFVNATAGTTVMGAFDDFNEVADVCKQYNLWMHVDVSEVLQVHRIFKMIQTNM